MKLRRLCIHNFRSIIDAEIEVHDYTMIVGANNAGKSNVLAALRAFYEDVKWSVDDVPKVGRSSDETWVELAFVLTDTEWASLRTPIFTAPRTSAPPRWGASSTSPRRRRPLTR